MLFEVSFHLTHHSLVLFFFLGTNQIATVRSTNHQLVQVEWIDEKGFLVGKDVNEDKIILFERWSVSQFVLICVNQIKIKQILLLLILSLVLSAIYNNYSLYSSQ